MKKVTALLYIFCIIAFTIAIYQFTDARIFESIDDKKKRYDMAVEYGYKDEIDITAEEIEISEKEAEEVLMLRKKRRTNQ